MSARAEYRNRHMPLSESCGASETNQARGRRIPVVGLNRSKYGRSSACTVIVDTFSWGSSGG